MNQYGVVIVETTSAALKAEKLLNAAGIKVQLIPTPREYSSDCGLALRFCWEQHDKVRQVLDANQLSTDKIFLLKDN